MIASSSHLQDNNVLYHETISKQSTTENFIAPDCEKVPKFKDGYANRHRPQVLQKGWRIKSDPGMTADAPTNCSLSMIRQW